MQVELRIGASVSLAEHWQRSATDRESFQLYARARGRSFNVTFLKSPRTLGTLVFRNFYTAALRLVQFNTDGSVRVLLNEHVLMKYMHCEDDAQNWHLLHLDQLPTPPDVTQLASLQFYLLQSSPRFETCDLQQLMLYESRGPSTDAMVSPLPTPIFETEEKSYVQLTHRLSRSSLLLVDARDVRENASQILHYIHEIRQLVHGISK